MPPSSPASRYYPATPKTSGSDSVPDDTFDRATKQAAELGIIRSEFFTRAARRYLDVVTMTNPSTA